MWPPLPETAPMKVLLIDDHPLILSALQQVIQGLGDDVTVVGVDSAKAARNTLADHEDFDLVLLDLQLGDANGFDLLADLRETYPALPVVVVSASDRTSDVIRSIDMGAMGFVPKRSSNAQLFDALRLVMSGGIYVPPDHDSESGHLQAVRREAGGQAYQTPPGSLESLGLTPRQTDVMVQLLQGKPNKIIARDMGLSPDTVKDHVQAVLRALGVNSRTQAVLAISQMTQGQAVPPAFRHSRK
jgi:DNA-binding NarL/FixJ family response regulator